MPVVRRFRGFRLSLAPARMTLDGSLGFSGVISLCQDCAIRGIAIVVGVRCRLGRRWVRLCTVVTRIRLGRCVAGAGRPRLRLDLFVEGSQANGAIRLGGLGGTGAGSLYPAESSPEGIAIDPAAGKIYWADTTSGAIRRRQPRRVGRPESVHGREPSVGCCDRSGDRKDLLGGRHQWQRSDSGRKPKRQWHRPESVQQRVLSGRRHDRPDRTRC